MRYFDQVRKGRIEIIPMIDIMLFLLVFFIMLTAQMIPDRGLAYHLPGSHTATRLQPATVTVIAGAAKASLQSLIRVMDACREAGVRAVSVATRPLAAGGAH